MFSMLSQIIKEEILAYIRSDAVRATEDTSRIHVDEIASRLAAFYERVRNIVDYREEHLLRKRFIHRVLRRRMVLNFEGSVAESIIKEIIRAGHLQNNSVSEAKIVEIENILKNHDTLLAHLPKSSGKERDRVAAWLFGITAHTIEENLFPPRRDTMLANIMYRTVKEKLTVRGTVLKEEAVDVQLFIAIQRALLKTDEEQLHYRLLKFMYPQWDTMGSEECKVIAKDLPALKKNIERLSKSSLAPYFFKLVNRYNTVFYVIGDLVDQLGGHKELEQLAEEPAQFEEEVRLVYDRRYKREKGRFNRLAFLSVLSFFISKITIALAIEIPVETYITRGFSWASTAVNIAFPPLLMLLIVASIRMPGERNFALVLREARNTVAGDAERKYVIDIPKKKGYLMRFVARSLYLATFLVVLYLLARLLFMFQFNTMNILVFVFFVSMVAATGVKIHNRAKELSLEAERVTTASFLLDLIALPFIRIGRWIIAGLAKFNPLAVLINILIEVPFQVVVEFLENFRGFIKSKKDEIV
ncbi:MAG: hypothetical protein AAB652_00720 [Patescibacteria group bacterium]